MTEIICIGSNVKEAILGQVNSRDLSAQVQAIAECPLPDDIQLRQRRRGEKRAPSPYNNFISTCMKSKHIKGFGNAAPAMKECAAEWRSQH